MQNQKTNFSQTMPIRAVSWWLTYEDFRWPDKDIADKIKWKADNMAKNGCNFGIIFGAHFRWDWLPVFTMLHDLIGTIAAELHERDILLFDHHSAVLAHRYGNREELSRMRQRHPHHISPAPSWEAAKSWEYGGSRLDSWRMQDVRDGKTIYLPAYSTVEFCFNNPDFQAAYLDYAKRLVAETGIDGLHCDDGIFYSGFTSCGCQHCKARLHQEYGLELPASDNLDFWGNYENADFHRYIDWRYRCTGDFLAKVKAALPPGLGLCTCLSAMTYAGANGCAEGREMIKQCNLLMQEMNGNMPDIDGNSVYHLPGQLYLLAHAQQQGIRVMGLGYGYSTASAGVIWAFNKFLGADTWLSTNKGRLSLPFSKHGLLPDDSELPGIGYRFEKEHPELFESRPENDVLVYFSEASRRYYGGGMNDYSPDYNCAIWKLFEAGYSVGVALEIPPPESQAVLVVASVAAMSEEEREALKRLAAAGGTVILCGPTGILDGTGAKSEQFTAQFGYRQELGKPTRQPGFPENIWFTAPPATLQNQREWTQLAPGLLYHPGRLQEKDAPDFLEMLPAPPAATAPGWFLRRHRDQAGDLLYHGFAADFEVGFNEAVEAMRDPDAPWENRIIDRAMPRNAASQLELPAGTAPAELFTPLATSSGKLEEKDGRLQVTLPPECYYFIVRVPQSA